MSVKERLLPLLYERGDYLSGEEAAELLGVSRNAVWKAVSALKADGYQIEAVTNRGYKLIDSGDVLSAAEIEKYLGPLSERLKQQQSRPQAEVALRDAFFHRQTAACTSAFCFVPSFPPRTRRL